MGTNYYLCRDICQCCGRGGKPIHIGKSSSGWCFALHIYPDEAEDKLPQNLRDWQDAWLGGVIKDEYDRVVTPAEMLKTITERSCPRDEPRNAAFLRTSGAVEGPNGLLRRIPDGHHCISSGPGTYDYCIGDFS